MALTLSGDDGVAGVNGSATTPAIQGTDTNTGLTFGTDTVNVVTGGSTRTTVDSSGRVLIGHSSSYGNNAGLQLFGTGVGSFIELKRGNAASGGPGLFFTKSRNTAVGSFTVVNSGDALGQIDFYGDDGTDTATPAAQILCEVDGTPGSNDMPGRLKFSTTADGASSLTEAMRIDSSQNLRFNSGYGSVATAYGVRAWANLNGIGTPATRQAGNISTIGDNGNGDYTFNLTTAMPDVNYAVVAMPSGTSHINNYAAAEKSDSRTSSAFRIQQWNGSSLYDLAICNVAVFR